MTAAFALARYRRTETADLPKVDDPHAVIQVTLGELVRSLDVIAAADADGQRGPDTHISRALTAIYILQSSLDFEEGADIAEDLFKIYEYARLQILGNWRGGSDNQINAAADALRDILGAWQTIGDQAR